MFEQNNIVHIQCTYLAYKSMFSLVPRSFFPIFSPSPSLSIIGKKRPGDEARACDALLSTIKKEVLVYVDLDESLIGTSRVVTFTIKRVGCMIMDTYISLLNVDDVILIAQLLLTLGAHAHEGYSTHFVCVFVCLFQVCCFQIELI